ncbi:hypothetical protein GC173_06400 [bacterium]|nr:hypothetical protein [bacterium]
MLETVALSLAYLVGGALVLLVAWGSGGLLCRSHRGDWLEEVLRAAVGLAILCFVTSVLGLIGVLYWWVALPLLVLIGGAGLWRSPFRAAMPSRSAVPVPAVLAVAVPAYMVLAGALVPDMSQDSMWYHLSVPQQWSFTGRLDAMPSVFPSCYPLAVESLYAALIPVGGAMLCSTVYGISAILVWLLVGLLAERVAGRWAAGVAMCLWIPLQATFTLAPVPAGNDLTAALFLLAGITMILLPLLDEGEPSLPPWLVGGFVLGQAIAAKPLCIPFAGMALLVASVSQWRRGSAALVAFAAASVAILASYLPWAIRGFLTTGLPVFPLGAGVLPVREAFLPTIGASKSLNSLYPLNGAGIWEAATKGAYRKIYMALHVGDALFLMAPLSALAGFASTRGRHRLVPLTFLAMWAPTLLLQGANEVLRYMALCYPLAAVALAQFLAATEARIGISVRRMLPWLLLCAAMGHYLGHQRRVASFRTIHWPWRPLLTESDQMAYARRSETGGAFVSFRVIRSLIPEAELVLMPDCPAPYYLHRPAIWNDYAVHEGGIAQRWAGFSADEAAAYIGQTKIQWILITSRDSRTGNSALCDELATRGLVEPIALSGDAAGSALYRVVVGGR